MRVNRDALHVNSLAIPDYNKYLMLCGDLEKLQVYQRGTCPGSLWKKIIIFQ